MDSQTAVLRQVLNETEHALAQAEQRLEEAQTEIARLKEEKRGLEHAIARRNGHTPEDSWEKLTRPEAVLRVLGEAKHSMSPSEITKVIREQGRQENPRFVSATLTILKRRGQVRQPQQGRWTVP
jgi:septal ring factor EnvC (AmiA/AmiB activator)